MDEQADRPGDHDPGRDRPTRGRDAPDARSTPSGSPQPGTPAGEQERARTPVTQQIGRIVVLVLIVLFGVFAASNAQPVDFSWLFGETRVTEGPGDTREGGVPLIVLLLISFVMGAAVGGLLAWQGGRHRRRARADEADGERRR